ncbi:MULTISPECIES: cyclase family protein [Halolamina]|uniref:Kynurenine formamidase n=1 Tax=Halolamina pelagica TaxID=699431 RepID=A0A1I5MMI5_9EURY|nr:MULTISPECIES: cyclase family protein [Halolamina]NHX36086.1 cyclase family protein [Halolamina sp. R1-12]SFP10730.1 Kynurenine formamidase [Halolamina pelagica]
MTLHDLTHPIESGMPVYPGDPEVSVDAADTYEEDGCRVSRLACGSHAGTHVDAPSHTEADGATLDAYPVSAFVRDAVVVECGDLDAREPIPEARVPGSETAPGADCVLFRTGWDRYWGSERYRDHPYLSVNAAERCAERDLAVGIDAFSPDPTPPAAGELALGDRDPFGAHHALLGGGVLVFENLTNLGAVPARVELRAQPIALGGDGAPVRAVGVDRS